MTTVDDYLSEISNRSNCFGSQLNSLMEYYNVKQLKDITFDQAKKFCEKLVREEINDNTHKNH